MVSDRSACHKQGCHSFLTAEDEAVGKSINVSKTFTEAALSTEAQLDNGQIVRDHQKEGKPTWMKNHSACAQTQPLQLTTHSFKCNQQDATLYNILYCCQSCTYFRRFFHPSSGAQTVNTASGICAATASVTCTRCCMYSLSSWWRAEKPPETCTASTAIKNIV